MRRQTGFFDVDERLKELSSKGDALERLNAIVDFEAFRPDLARAVPRSDGSKGGRPAFDHVLMWKIHAREGLELSVSTLADQVGACVTALRPLYRLIEAHVLAAERLHGDDPTVPILAKGKTVTGRIWTYVRDDRLFGSRAPPAALRA